MENTGALVCRGLERLSTLVPGTHLSKLADRCVEIIHKAINIEALCAAPPEALAHSPSQMPLSCLVAPLSQRELHKDGGGSGGGEWRGEEGARRPGPEGQFLHHVLRHALRNALRNVLRRVLHVLVLHVSPKESVGGRWKMTRATMSTSDR